MLHAIFFHREEELKYLEFVKDVTNDVLTRGIFTNTVLKRVFQYHVDKNKGQLKLVIALCVYIKFYIRLTSFNYHIR